MFVGKWEAEYCDIPDCPSKSYQTANKSFQIFLAHAQYYIAEFLGLKLKF